MADRPKQKRGAKKAARPLTPRTATTHEKIVKLPRDNWEHGDFWMMIDGGEVIITQQKLGEQPTAKIRLPRRAFNHFIDKYNGEK